MDAVMSNLACRTCFKSAESFLWPVLKSIFNFVYETVRLFGYVLVDFIQFSFPLKQNIFSSCNWNTLPRDPYLAPIWPSFRCQSSSFSGVLFYSANTGWIKTRFSTNNFSLFLWQTSILSLKLFLKVFFCCPVAFQESPWAAMERWEARTFFSTDRSTYVRII